MNDAIKWYQSRTIIATIVSGIAGIMSFSGHTIDPQAQNDIVTGIADVANGAAILAAFVATYYRTKATAPIKPLTTSDAPAATTK